MFPFKIHLFSLLIFTTMTIITAKPYKPTDYFLLDCGSSSSTITSDRKWDSDYHSEYVPSNITATSFSSNPYYLDPSVPKIPYSTARIFKTSTFTYTFPVSSGPKFVRLHFYPATYSNLNANQSFFSVSSNGYSLLTNFSAFQAASYLANARGDAGVNGPPVPHLVKEFLIYVTDAQNLNVTFTPSHNSYAFINGIEIVSMPENLYFNAKDPKYVNQFTGPFIDNHTALENIYRLNMGGGQVSGKDDTGMYRTWYQDNNYIYGAALGVLWDYDNSIMYSTGTPNYTAPEVVYQTQRSMGTFAKRYNLTWILPVDSGFYYMLRLHFCNIIPQYIMVNYVNFRIFINNQTAEEQADLFYWTQGSGYPLFKDYIFFVNNSDGHRGKQDLWLEMHPNSISYYADAYLNGLELFKLSMDGDLSSPNPELSPKVPQPSPASAIKGNKKIPPYAKIIIGVVGGCLILLSVLLLIVLRRKPQISPYSTAYGQPSWGQTSSNTALPSNRCRRFTLQEVSTATNEFNDSYIIGSGGFGKVYKGYVDNATTVVAIKRLNPSSSQGFHEFRTEVGLLSKLRHVHLVSMIGYCEDNGEMVLVYDYMANGTLREHLYKKNKPTLSWKRRLDICIGAAKGLLYLHSSGKRAIIHRDVKSTNILLDENWVAKVSDFGLSKLGSKDPSKTHVSTLVKGSFGYIDPEYCRTKQLTEKSDVYSFGVVLWEVLCARPAIVQRVSDEQVNLAEWGKTCYRKGTLAEIIDPKLSGEISPGCLRKFGEVACSCLHEEVSERPAMEEVVWGLEFALELQEAADKMDGLDTMPKKLNYQVIDLVV